jgi:hypothetical protein
MLQRTLPAGFIAPCLPIKTDKLPSSSEWLHEIKHDGFRIIARKERLAGAALRPSTQGRFFVLILGAPEGAYANAALFIALVRKLIDKGIISKEEMSGIVDEAGALLSQGNPIAMRQALQTLRWFRKDIGIEGPTTEG